MENITEFQYLGFKNQVERFKREVEDLTIEKNSDNKISKIVYEIQIETLKSQIFELETLIGNYKANLKIHFNC